MHYTIVINKPGYLPESEPFDIEIDESGERGEAEQVLQAIYAEVENRAIYDDGALDKWDKLLSEIEDNYEHVTYFYPRAGFLYLMPDGYVIEATYHASDKSKSTITDSEKDRIAKLALEYARPGMRIAIGDRTPEQYDRADAFAAYLVNAVRRAIDKVNEDAE